MSRALYVAAIAVMFASSSQLALAEPGAAAGSPKAESSDNPGRAARAWHQVKQSFGQLKHRVKRTARRAVRSARGRIWAATPLVRTAERWASQRSKSTSAEQRVALGETLRGLKVKAHPRRSSLERVERRIEALRGTSGQRAQRDYARAHAERAVLLKQLWDDRELHAEHAWRGGRAEAIVETLDRELVRGGVYATSRPDGWRDQRILRDHADLRRDARFLAERIRAMPALLPREIDAASVVAQLDSTLEQVEGKPVYTRPGMAGLVDLISDPHLGQRYVERVAGDGRQRRLAERLHATAAVATAADALELQRIELSRERDELPLEVQYLLETDPAARADLATLSDHGLHLQKVRSTPPAVLEAIARVMVISQENFLRNWLPPLVREGRPPKLQPSERGIERALGMGLIDDRNVTAEDLTKDVELIRKSIGDYVKFVVPNATPELQAKLDRLNEKIDWIRREYTVNRMVFDNAHHRTNEAQEIIKKMAVVGPVAHLLELAGRGVLAKVFAGSADDLLGEWAEIKALLGSGFSKREILKRLRVAVPVFGLATFGALEVENLLHHGHDLAAGATFGISAVALSLTTAAQSMMMYRKSYDRLLEQGKIPGKIGQLASDPAFQQQLQSLRRQTGELSQPQRRRALLELAKRTLREKEGKGGLSGREVEALVAQLQGLGTDEIAEQLRAPTRKQRWKEVLLQDFSNPAHLGILVGALASPVVGMTAGALGLMHNGFVMAGIGSVEALGALSTVLAARRLADKRYERTIRRAMTEHSAKGSGRTEAAAHRSGASPTSL